MSDVIKVGDKVEHVDGRWEVCETVREFFTMNDQEFVRFNAGGFWLASRLRRVNK